MIGFKNVGTESEPRMVPVTRKETFEEKDLRIRTYVSQPTDHSTLPMRADFMSQVVAYDLPIGYCDATSIKNLWQIYGEKRTGRRERILISPVESQTKYLNLI